MLSKKQIAARSKLRKLGFWPVGQADFTEKGGYYIEYWQSKLGQTIRIELYTAPSKRAGKWSM